MIKKLTEQDIIKIKPKKNIMNFKEIYSEISRINKKDPATHAERLGKLFEEAGELAKSLNKTNGRKILSAEDTPKSIDLEVLHEAADTIQNVISIIDGFGFTHDELMVVIAEKNIKWENKVDKTKLS